MLHYLDKRMRTIILSVCSVELIAQQDIHSSNWYFSNALVNPAAVATDGSSYSIFSNFRMQYFTIGGAQCEQIPYQLK